MLLIEGPPLLGLVSPLLCRYDLFGSNFQVPLRLALTSMSMDEDDIAGGLIPDSELPELPGDLCGIWAYIQWESAGCPNRSQAESDAEYKKAIAVSHSCLQPCSTPACRCGPPCSSQMLACVDLPRLDWPACTSQPAQVTSRQHEVPTPWHDMA